MCPCLLWNTTVELGDCDLQERATERRRKLHARAVLSILLTLFPSTDKLQMARQATAATADDLHTTTCTYRPSSGYSRLQCCSGCARHGHAHTQNTPTLSTFLHLAGRLYVKPHSCYAHARIYIKSIAARMACSEAVAILTILTHKCEHHCQSSTNTILRTPRASPPHLHHLMTSRAVQNMAMLQ